MTASTTVMNNILIPQMEQKFTTKVNEVKEVVKSDLKTELDGTLSSELTGLTQKITTQVNEKSQELTEQITTRISETQEKVIFSVVRMSDVGSHDITYDTVIANIGDSIDASSGTFTTKKKGLYFFTFTAVSQNEEKGVVIDVKKNGGQLFHIEDGNAKNQANIGKSWMLQLNVGDTIVLRNAGNQLHGCDSEDWIQFSGQLLHAD